MKKIVKIFSMSMLLIQLFSCTEQLRLEPVSSISNASYWKTEDDAKGLLYGMYMQLRVLAENNSLLLWGEGRSEVLGLSFGSATNERVYWDNLLDKNNAGASWKELYTVVHHTNLLLKYVPDIKFAREEDKDTIIAQAYAMRAFVYFWMVRIWGDAIIIKEPVESFNPSSIQRERSPANEVFSFIKSDLDNSLQHFSNNTLPEKRAIWSKAAVNTLKADVYLWTAKKTGGDTKDLTTALSALDNIEGADVSLLDNFESVFDYSNKGNKEILFAIRFQEFESAQNWGRASYMNASSISPNFDQETKDAIGVMGDGGGTFTLTETVRNQFEFDDQRRKATFIEMFTVDQSGNKDFYGSFCKKYDGVISGGSRLFVDDVVIYRYADVLLMKAEIKNALGEDPSLEINQIRKRAFGDQFSNHIFVTGNRSENEKQILKERLLEFALEGKRWWDLVRFEQAFDLVPSLKDRKGQDYLLLFPISETILSLETKVKQNPGYE